MADFLYDRKLCRCRLRDRELQHKLLLADVIEDIELKTGKRKEEIHEALLEQRKQYNSVESVENE